ncbi:GMC oxidoreductase [Staphylococcus aureus]
MGPASDPMAVVDPLTMKVHGMENLRVVDASAMPRQMAIYTHLF